jgi:hypothetical protein
MVCSTFAAPGLVAAPSSTCTCSICTCVVEGANADAIGLRRAAFDRAAGRRQDEICPLAADATTQEGKTRARNSGEAPPIRFPDLLASVVAAVAAPIANEASRPGFGLTDGPPYSTVTLFAKLRGWSTSLPMTTAA